MLAQKGELTRGVEWLVDLEKRTHTVRDIPFDCARHLALAQAYASVGDSGAASRHLLTTERLGIVANRELQGQYYFGTSIAMGDRELGVQLRRRATTLWDEQCIVSTPRELSRRLLKLSGGSVDDYATFSTSVTSPSC